MNSGSMPRQTKAAPTPGSLPAASPLRGILLLIGSTLFFSMADIVTKLLTATLPAVQVAWMRYATFALLVVPFVLAAGGPALFRTRRPGLQVVRGLGLVGSSIMFIQALRYLPVADATAVFFVSPILIMALSIVLLGEQVGWRRWTAAGVGLIGVLIVIRPGTGAFQAAALLPVVGASSWAVGAVMTRKMGGADHPLTTLVYSALVGTVVLSAALPFGWAAPDWREVALGLGMGLLFTVGQCFALMAYRSASASLIAPFTYVQMIWSGALGYLVLGSVPDLWTVVGACVIAGSGLYTAYRERVRALQKRFPA